MRTSARLAKQPRQSYVEEECEEEPVQRPAPKKKAKASGLTKSAAQIVRYAKVRRSNLSAAAAEGAARGLPAVPVVLYSLALKKLFEESAKKQLPWSKILRAAQSGTWRLAAKPPAKAKAKRVAAKAIAGGPKPKHAKAAQAASGGAASGGAASSTASSAVLRAHRMAVCAAASASG